MAARVRAVIQERGQEFASTALGFDERDMVGWFIAAGFEAVGVSYELLYTRLPSDRDQALTFLDTRGNPTAPTWREAAVEALGPDAERYLNILVDARHGGLSTGINAHVFLTATREAGSP